MGGYQMAEEKEEIKKEEKELEEEMTDLHDDSPDLKGGQTTELPDGLQAAIIASKKTKQNESRDYHTKKNFMLHDMLLRKFGIKKGDK
jgi:hypothetical protein